MATVKKIVDPTDECEDYADPDFQDDVQLFREDYCDEEEYIYADPDFSEDVQLFMAEKIVVLDNDFA